MLLFCTSLFLFALLVASPSAAAGVCPDARQNPVVFIHGYLGSVLEAQLTGIPANVPLPHASCARKTDAYRCIWIRVSELVGDEVDCLQAYLSLDFNGSAGRGRGSNVDGVAVRVPDFGGVYAVDRLDPEDPIVGSVSNYMHNAIEALRLSGFDEGRTIFAAPYDWRRFPQQRWIDDTRELVEAAYRLSGGHRVVVTSHSMGGPVSYLFLMSQTPQWRATYIERWVPVAPVWTGAPIAAYMMLAKATLGLPWYIAKFSGLMRHLESTFFLLPNAAFGPAPIVTTPSHTYDWKTLPDVLERAGISWASAAIEVGRSFLEPFGFAHPGINTTIVWSTGIKTVTAIHYDLDAEVGVTAPWPEFGDGDSQVPTAGASYLYDKWSADPATAKMTDKLVFSSGSLATSHIPIMAYKGYIDYLTSVTCNA